MRAGLRFDVCVLGAGPAGSAVARRLAQLGHSVVIIEKAAFPRDHVGESIPGSVLPLLDVLSVRGVVEAAGFLRPDGAIVRWGGEEQKQKLFGDPGFQVDRGRFDTILLDAAVASGATCLQPARVLGIDPRQDGWKISLSLAREMLLIQSNFLVDATGRSNLTGGIKLRRSPPMLALWAYWQAARATGSETLVESAPEEWFWGAPLPNGTFNATVFLDPARYRGGVQKCGGLEAFYRSLLTRSRLLRPPLTSAACGPVRACDATCYISDELVTAHSIKIGEAAFAIDPLSSQGVQTAIGTAIHASAVIHTILRRPENTRAAMNFHALRQQEASRLHADSAAAFYTQAAHHFGTDFWRQGIQYREEKVDRAAEAEQASLPSYNTWIQFSPGTRTERVPCLQSDYIVETTGFRHPQTGHSVAFVEGVAVAELLADLQMPRRAIDLVQHWSSRMGAERALRIFAGLWRSGILCTAPAAEQASFDSTTSADLSLASACK